MSLLIRFSIALTIVFVISCTSKEEKDSEQLKQFLTEVSPEGKVVENILVLTENGCPNCNRSFAIFLEQQLLNEQTLCVVSAQGHIIDLSPFIDNENILLDFDGELKRKYPFINQSSAILLDKNGTVDTVVEIEATDLEQSLKYLQGRIGRFNDYFPSR